MNHYKIKYSIILKDKKEVVGTCTKYAHSKSGALAYLLKGKPDKKTGFCIFKKGQAARIIDVQEIDPIEF